MLARALLFCAIFVLLCGAWVWLTPFETALLSEQNITSTRIVDRYGRGLREVLGSSEGRARAVAIDDISGHLISATVHAEDQRFWSHYGVDPLASAGASWQTTGILAFAGGASTPPQQVVKLLRSGNPPRGFPKKSEKAVPAIRLKKAPPKRKTPPQYLTRAPYENH